MNPERSWEMKTMAAEFKSNAESLIEVYNLEIVKTTLPMMRRERVDLHRYIYDIDWPEEKLSCLELFSHQSSKIREIYPLKFSTTILTFYELWRAASNFLKKHPSKDFFTLFFTLKQPDKVKIFRIPRHTITYCGFVNQWHSFYRKLLRDETIKKYTKNPNLRKSILSGEIPRDLDPEVIRFHKLREECAKVEARFTVKV